MYRVVIAAVLAMAVLAILAKPAFAREATTQPAKPLLQQVYDLAAEARTWAKWGCILAGLALLGVLWIGWSMQTLAKNQVQLGRMIQAGKQE